jgi:hypothetical protein
MIRPHASGPRRRTKPMTRARSRRNGSCRRATAPMCNVPDPRGTCSLSAVGRSSGSQTRVRGWARELHRVTFPAEASGCYTQLTSAYSGGTAPDLHRLPLCPNGHPRSSQRSKEQEGRETYVNVHSLSRRVHALPEHRDVRVARTRSHLDDRFSRSTVRAMGCRSHLSIAGDTSCR